MSNAIKTIFKKNTSSHLAKLIAIWVEAEADLDKALKNLNDYISQSSEEFLELDPKYSHLKTLTEAADKEWNQRYLDVLAYDPENVQEIGQKILVALNSISEGLSDPRLYMSIEKNAHALLESKDDININDMKGSEDGSPSQRLFLIDDSALDRMLMKQAFLTQSDNLDFVEMDNGNEIIQEIKSKKPIATLIDLNMPRIHGLEILKMIRCDDDLKNHPVWIISASKEENDKTLSLSSGADGFYKKPDSLAAYNQIAADILESVYA